MLHRHARLYLRAVFAAALVLFVLALACNLALFAGCRSPFAQLAAILFLIAIVIGNVVFPILQEQRPWKILRFWKNELHACPRWMRIACNVLFLYAAVFAVSDLFPRPLSNSCGFAPSFAALSLCLYGASLCALYSVLSSASVSVSELARKAEASFFRGTLAALLFAACVYALLLRP